MTGDEQRLDVFDEDPPDAARMDAKDVVKSVAEPDVGVRVWRRKLNIPPVVRVADRFITGVLDFRAVEFPYLLEFVRCRFERAPDLRQAKLAGVEFDGCWLPGLLGRNLHSDNDITLRGCTVSGAQLELTDADIQGSLMLEWSTLDNPGKRALYANRLALGGALLATGLTVHGELRVPGLRVGGNLTLSGARLHNPDGLTLSLNAARIAGNLLCDPATEPETGVQRSFRSNGLLFMTSAHITSDLVLRGARLTPNLSTTPEADDPHYDARAALVADRIQLDGNALLDMGMESTGTVRVVSGQVGGSIRLTKAVLDMSEHGTDGQRALNLAGTKLGGDLIAYGTTLNGLARLVDVNVGGSAIFGRASWNNPDGDVVEGRRMIVGGNLDFSNAVMRGSVLLQGASIAASLSLRNATLADPGYYSRDGRVKPSLNLRAVQVGRDMMINGSDGGSFTATGEVRLHRAVVGRGVKMSAAILGSDVTRNGTALNAFGLSTQELELILNAPPVGEIVLRHAQCASLADDEKLYSGSGPEDRPLVDMEDFRYGGLADPVKLEDDARVIVRLGWLRKALRGAYRPGPYDQLATVLRDSGNEEHASTVLIHKQRQRYAALARGYRVFGPPMLLWSTLQRLMVGYGYRPMRALAWLLLLLLAGTVWFSTHGRLPEINTDDHLTWNPFLFTLDQLVPIIDFGNKDRWRLEGTAQWIASTLVASGWILATTVATGVTRMLRRNS